MQLWRLAKQVQSPLHWQPRMDGHAQDESPLAWAEAFVHRWQSERKVYGKERVIADSVSGISLTQEAYDHF